MAAALEPMYNSMPVLISSDPELMKALEPFIKSATSPPPSPFPSSSSSSSLYSPNSFSHHPPTQSDLNRRPTPTGLNLRHARIQEIQAQIQHHHQHKGPRPQTMKLYRGVRQRHWGSGWPRSASRGTGLASGWGPSRPRKKPPSPTTRPPTDSAGTTPASISPPSPHSAPPSTPFARAWSWRSLQRRGRDQNWWRCSSWTSPRLHGTNPRASC